MSVRDRSFLGVTVLLLLSACGTPRGPAESGKAPSDQRVSAAAVADPFPRACVDCHVNRPDIGMDVRISTLMAQWKEGASPGLVDAARAASPAGVTISGRHPPLPGGIGEIPATCLECHGRSSDSAPRFALLMHRVHLVGGESNHYVREFGGRCEPCHKLDRATGAWSVPSGDE